MSIWGVLSDVHGNLAALEGAIALCRQHGAERFAFLGDLLGRGDSDRCVELIRSLADLSVVGNRDLDWQDRVGAETRAYVLGLPPVARAADFLAAHGDARLDRDLSTADIRRGFSRVRRRLTAETARIAFFGHSHHARVWRLRSDEPAELLYDVTQASRIPVRIPLDDSGHHFVVNVGATGLPFPGKGPPSCAVYDPLSCILTMLPL